MKLIVVTLLAISILSVPCAQATLTGLFDPYNRDSDPDVRSAVWDSFSETVAVPGDPVSATTYSYAGIPSITSTFTGLSLVQTLPHINSTTGGGPAQGAGLLNGGDVYYSSTRPQSWIMNATTGIDLGDLSFQIKVANVLTVRETVFLPNLTGVGDATYIRSALTQETIFGSFEFYVIEYRWNNLDIAAGSDLEITFSLAGGSTGTFTRIPIDFVALDGATIPEPTTALLMGLGIGLTMLRSRRRAKKD